jgi:hypothetical protein
MPGSKAERRIASVENFQRRTILGLPGSRASTTRHRPGPGIVRSRDTGSGLFLSICLRSDHSDVGALEGREDSVARQVGMSLGEAGRRYFIDCEVPCLSIRAFPSKGLALVHRK